MSLFDIIPFMVFLFMIGITVLVSYLIIDNFEDFSAFATFSSVMTKMKSAMSYFNYGFLFLVAGFGIATLVSAFMIDTHPVFFIVSVILLVIFTIVSVSVTNSFNEIATSAAFTSTAENFNIIVLVMRNLPKIVVVWGALIMIVLYGKLR